MIENIIFKTTKLSNLKRIFIIINKILIKLRIILNLKYLNLNINYVNFYFKIKEIKAFFKFFDFNLKFFL